MNLLGFYPAVEFQCFKSQHLQVWGSGGKMRTKYFNNNIDGGKNRSRTETQRKNGFGDIVYIKYQCSDEDDEVEEDEHSRMCFYGDNKKRNTQASTSIVLLQHSKLIHSKLYTHFRGQVCLFATLWLCNFVCIQILLSHWEPCNYKY